MQTHPHIPEGRPARFRATVHGTVFADRTAAVAALHPGDRLDLHPDPPGQEPDQVWVHNGERDTLGHLPGEISAWMAPWLREGGLASARAVKVGGPQTPSWRRLVIEVVCTG